MSATRLPLGLALGLVFSLLAYGAGSLSANGALAAALVGGLTLGVGGLVPSVLLLTFFISSSVLTRVGLGRKQEVAAAFSKGGRRDYGQVLANGGLATLFAVLHGVTREGLWLFGLCGALAAVNADTWATELGVLSAREPRLITTGKAVVAGSSGAVTAAGTLAAAAGSALIGLAGWALTRSWPVGLAAVVGGLGGTTVDSLLGATVQGIFYCPACQRETERHPLHSCGTGTEPLRGWRWLNNDLVNLIASAVGASIGLAVWRLSQPL